MNSEEDDWKQIIHNDCGLPIEFCICKSATIHIVEEEDERRDDENK